MRTFAGPIRRILVRMATVLASIVLTIGALEVTLRIVAPGRRFVMRRDDWIGTHYIPNFAGNVDVPEAGRPVYLRFNGLGFRGGPASEEKKPGVNRVVVLGDSFIAAVAVDEKDTMTCRLADELSQQVGGQWESLNFGVSGHSTANELLNWRRYIRDLKPDILVHCFFSGNDVADNHPFLEHRPAPFFQLDAGGELQLVPVDQRRATMTRWLDENSRLYTWNRDLAIRLCSRITSQVAGVPSRLQVMNSVPPQPFPEAWTMTEKLMQTLAQETAAAGVKLVVVQIPLQEQVVDADWDRLMKQIPPEQRGAWDRDYPERRLKEICDRAGVPVIPLLDAFRAKYAPATPYTMIEGHWNESANALAASVIAQQLSASNFMTAFRVR